jgi:hypothetical protein
MVDSANSLRQEGKKGNSALEDWHRLSDRLSDQLISSIVNTVNVSAAVHSAFLEIYLAVASSITRTLDRFRMARAMQSNCFSLENALQLHETPGREECVPSREVLASFRHR